MGVWDIRWLAVAGDYAIAHTRWGTLAAFGWAPRTLDANDWERAAVDAEAFFAREAGKYRALTVATGLMWLGTLAMLMVSFTLQLALDRLFVVPPPFQPWLVRGLPWIPLTVYTIWALVLGPAALRHSVHGTRNVHELVSSILAAGPEDALRMWRLANSRGMPRLQALFERNSRLREAVRRAA